ncbi:MAG: 50S ribosomal protein L16 [Candidatus Omnitrophota bacterium]|nr:50S ribosomal protein L16 [Candidatus Omnitrophota bacterium]HLD87878.1 50S ribosomal protein L16 [Candidatus Omnitrophota bacterium]
MLMPKRVKYRKSQKGKSRGIAVTGSQMHFGEYGLKALENGFLPARQLEASRVVVARKLHGTGKLWISAFPHKSITKKPAETRMGKGKGDLDHWVAVVRRGKIIFELGGVPADFAKQVLRLVAFKLSLRTKFVTREGH